MTKDSTVPTAAGNKTGITLTPRDTEILISAIAKCTKDPVTIDYQKLANMIGLASAASSKASWHGIKKKLDKGAEALIAAATNADAKANADEAEETAELAAEVKKGGKREGTKRKAADIKTEEIGEEDEEPEVAKSPIKKGRKAAASNKGKVVIEATEIFDVIKAEEDVAEPEPVKKAPAKKRTPAVKKVKAAAEDGKGQGEAVKAEEDTEPEAEKKVPAKKGRPARAKKPTAKAAEAEEADDADE